MSALTRGTPRFRIKTADSEQITASVSNLIWTLDPEEGAVNVKTTGGAAIFIRSGHLLASRAVTRRAG